MVPSLQENGGVANFIMVMESNHFGLILLDFTIIGRDVIHTFPGESKHISRL